MTRTLKEQLTKLQAENETLSAAVDHHAQQQQELSAQNEALKKMVLDMKNEIEEYVRMKEAQLLAAKGTIKLLSEAINNIAKDT